MPIQWWEVLASPAHRCRRTLPALPTVQAVAPSKGPAASKAPLSSGISEFYMTDAISRASKVMAKCIRTKAEGQQQSAQASVGI